MYEPQKDAGGDQEEDEEAGSEDKFVPGLAGIELVIEWTEKVPGRILELCVEEGSMVREGDVLCRCDCSPESQQVALVTAADEVSLQQSSNATGINDRYQALTDRLVSLIASPAQDTSQLLRCCKDLERAMRDFLETSRMYGRLIISEMHLPVERKTVRPINLGGVLGGAKYVVRGVLFKIPVAQMFAAYPDPMHIANKVQGHELKGLKAYFAWFFNRGAVGLVSFPLTAVIDYKGHRITAMTQLPIRGTETLVYGSDDAGRECQVRNTHPGWSNCIREASIGLNLKPHWAVNGRTAQGEIELASCVDLEGHKGLDGRFYLLDFSRAFPCDYKEAEGLEPHDKLWPFYSLMRPEFVKKWRRPLSADAYSNFQSLKSAERKDEVRANHADIREATEALRNDVTSTVCLALFQAYDVSFSLRHVFHRHGLNMRYLGIVYRKLVGEMFRENRENLYKLVVVEALMRVFKNELRSRLRRTQLEASGEDSESVLLVAAANALNAFFCAPESVEAWTRRCAFCTETLVKSFNFTPNHAQLATTAFVKNDMTVVETLSTGGRALYSLKFAVLLRLEEAAGLWVRPELMDELRESSGGGFRRSFARRMIFDDGDLRFEERIKHLDVVERARGLSEYLLAEMCEPKRSVEHLLRGYDILTVALATSPNDPWLSLLMGDICARTHVVVSMANGKRKATDRSQANDQLVSVFHTRAIFFYRQACAFENSAQVFVRLGQFIFSTGGSLQECEDLFLKALEICDRQNAAPDEGALVGLVHVLEKKGDAALAAELRERTKTFVKFRDQWMGASAGDRSVDERSSFAMGKNRVSQGLKSPRMSGDKARPGAASVAGPPGAPGAATLRGKASIGSSLNSLVEKVTSKVSTQARSFRGKRPAPPDRSPSGSALRDSNSCIESSSPTLSGVEDDGGEEGWAAAAAAAAAAGGEPGSSELLDAIERNKLLRSQVFGGEGGEEPNDDDDEMGELFSALSRVQALRNEYGVEREEELRSPN